MATGLGIDIGAESIKIVAVRTAGAVVSVTAAMKLTRPAAARVDGQDDGGAHRFAPENLGEELKRANLRRVGTVGVSGRDVILKYLITPPMPPPKLKSYIDMEIGGKIGSKGPAENTYDYRLLSLPGGSRNDLVIMAGVCKNEYLYKVNDALSAAKVNATRISPSCFGLINAYMQTQKAPPGETVVLVDVGHELMEIAIVEDNRIYFARSAPGGGKKFTAALDKILRMGPEKAADFKHQRAKLYPEGEKIPSKQELAFQAALKEGADNIAGAIRSSITFCRTQTKMTKLDYHRIILSGGGARLNGLRAYLEKKIGKPVQILDLYNQLDLRKLDAASARCFEGESPDMSVALGLAIIDADPSSFHFSLIPEQVIRKRMFWQKTIYGIAAAVVLAAGVMIPWSNASNAVNVQAARAGEFADLEKQALAKRKAFKSKIDENLNKARQVDYYARQTRVGKVYLDLFARLRAETPADTQIVFFGPSGEAPAGGGGGSLELNPSDVVLNCIVRGHYDTDAYPGTKFNDAFEAMRKKLLEIPGLADVTWGQDLPATKPGEKPFEFNVTLKDGSKQWAAVSKTTAATPSNPTAPANPAVAQKGE